MRLVSPAPWPGRTVDDMKLKRDHIILISVLVLVTAVLFNIFIAPQGKRLKAARLRIESAANLLEAREHEKNRLNGLKEENDLLKDRLQNVENAFIEKDKVHQYLQDLVVLAEKTGNKLRSVDPLETKKPVEKGVKRIFVKLDLSGSYISIVEFMGQLLNGEKVLDISDILIKRPAGGSNELTASFVVSLLVAEYDSRGGQKSVLMEKGQK